MRGCKNPHRTGAQALRVLLYALLYLLARDEAIGLFEAG
jgi:hypothetical protein